MDDKGEIMRGVKKIISFFLVMMMFVEAAASVYAQELDLEDSYAIEFVETEDYFKEISLDNTVRGKYVGTIITRIANPKSGEVAMNVSVHCFEDMLEITTVFYLQKLIDGEWISVGSASVTVENTYSISKTAKTSGVKAGTYRAKTVTKVVHPSGQSELSTSYSGSIVVS